MSSPAESKWPSYPVGPQTHIHALGVVSINYNGLEIALSSLIREYLGAEDEVHAYIFQALNLHSQLELFRLCIEKEKDKAVRQRLLDFSHCFQTCAGNRNLLMHANLHASDTTEDLLGLAKRSRNKPHIYNDMQLSIKELRSVADDIHALFAWAANLWKYIRYRERQDPFRATDDQPFPMPALPETPSKPMSLADRFQPTQKKR